MHSPRAVATPRESLDLAVLSIAETPAATEIPWSIQEISPAVPGFPSGCQEHLLGAGRCQEVPTAAAPARRGLGHASHPLKESSHTPALQALIFPSVKWNRGGITFPAFQVCSLCPFQLCSTAFRLRVMASLKGWFRTHFWLQTIASLGKADIVFIPLPNLQRNKAKPRNPNSLREGGVSKLCRWESRWK